MDLDTVKSLITSMKDDLAYVERARNTMNHIRADSSTQTLDVPIVYGMKLRMDEMEKTADMIRQIINRDGSSGSGNWGHVGVHGQWGGSAPGGGVQFRGAPIRGGYSSAAKVRENATENGYDYGHCNVGDPQPGTSLAKHSKDGKLTPKREGLHRKIIDTAFAGIPKADGQATMTFLGGGPASGKSTIIKDGSIETPNRTTTICIDSDRVKTMLPEYQEGVKNGDENAANMCHRESSILAYRIVDIAQRNGYNVMIDGTGDGTVINMQNSIEEARNCGMRVEGIYVTCDTATALERSAIRGAETGRVVPTEYITSVHSKVSSILPQIASDFDHVRLYSTNGEKAVLVAESSERSSLTVKDISEYQKFVNKRY